MRTRTLHILLLTCLLALTGAMQVMAVTYSPYRGKARRTNGAIYSTAEMAKETAGTYAPSIDMASTSTMSGGTRADASTPLVNGDGSVATGAYGIPTQKRNGSPGGGPGTPGGGDDDNQQIYEPVGDAVLPLLLMALAFAAIRIYRKRKTA